LEARSLGQAAETSDKTTRRHGEGVLSIFGALDGDGKSVRNQQEAASGAALVVDNAGHGDGVQWLYGERSGLAG